MKKLLCLLVLPLLVSCTALRRDSQTAYTLATSWPPTQIGVVGSWQTRQVVLGLEEGGYADSVWDYQDCRYGRGDLKRWARDGGANWVRFDTLLREHPETDVIWFQVLLYGQKRGSYSRKQWKQLRQALENLRKRTSVPVYLSPMAGHRGYRCRLHGPGGSSASQALVKKMVRKKWKTYNLRMGPWLGDLTTSRIKGDRCIANKPGRRFMSQKVAVTFNCQGSKPDAYYRIDLTPGGGGGLHQ